MESPTPVRNSPRRIAVPPPLAIIDGQFVNVSGIRHFLDVLFEKLSDPRSFLVCTLNLDHLVKRRQIPEMREAYARAEVVTADGFPIIILSRLNGSNLERAPGADLIEPLCKEAARSRFSVFFLGTTFQALCTSARRLTVSYPDLEICGVYAPPAGFEVHSEFADEAIRLIRESHARLCFLALGAPLQERFAVRALDETIGVGFLAIGAGLDYLAGTQSRCPRLLRRMYLEWAWRLMSNPRRLGLRYARCGTLFVGLLIKSMSFSSKKEL